MGRRCKFRSLPVACFISFLAICITAYTGWIYGIEHDARMVSIRAGDDADLSVGLPAISKPHSTHDSQSIPGRESNEDSIIWDMDTMNLIDILDFEEGYEGRPYLCSGGYVTVGMGTRLHTELGLNPKDFPIVVSREMAEAWLHMRVKKHTRKLGRRADIGPTFKRLDDDRKAIILSMSYQMGTTGVSKFKKMWKALEVGDHEEASKQALDSLWATQTPERAERHAQVLAGTPLDVVYKH